MAQSVPVYKLTSFPRHEPDAPFYMTRLEKLVREFKRIGDSHSHTFYLMMWITHGSGTHTIDFKTYEVEPFQLYFLTPGQVHSWQLSADIRGYDLFFEANFFRSRFGNRLHQYPFYHSNQHRPLLHVTDQRKLVDDLFVHAWDEYKQRQTNQADVFLSYLHLVLETANRIYHQQWPGADTLLYDHIRQYEDLLEKQFLTVREVGEYANQMNLSPNYLNHICKRVLDKTASQLLYERLTVEAQRLLTHTSQSVKEVAFRLGFDDPSYFVRFFKKHTSQTPAEFRQWASVNR